MKFLKDKNGFIKLLIVFPFLITFLLNTFYFSNKDNTNNIDTLNNSEINKDNTNNNEEIKENNVDSNYNPINNNIITEEDPLILSNKYHEGFEKRKNSSLYPYKPHIRKELPRMYIYSSSGNNDFATKPTRTTKDDFEREDCLVSLVNCEEQYTFSKVDASIKVRGNVTANYVKKPFRLKFDVKRNILGLNNNNKFKSWILKTEYETKNKISDYIAFYMANQIFGYDNIYTSDITPIELYINNSYWGLYYVEEKQQVNKNRVNIDDVEDREPKGSYQGIDIGYYFESDAYAPDEERRGTAEPIFRISFHDDAPFKSYSGIVCYQRRNDSMDNGNIFNTFSVHSDIYSDEQLSFIGNYVDKVYYVLYEAVYNKRYYVFDETYTNLIERKDLTSYEVIDKVININSFVDKFILEEICINNDITSSQFFQVDMSFRGDKKMGFISQWDYGNAMGKNWDFTEGLWTCERLLETGKGANAWFMLLPHENWFMKLVKEKWNQLIENQVLYNTLHYVDEFKINYSNYYIKDVNRWNQDINVENMQNKLFDFLKNRINGLNRIFNEGRNLF